MERIKIAAFDESALFRAGIVHILNTEPGMEVVAEGGSVPEELHLSMTPLPDVVIIDSKLIGSALGLSPSIKLLVLTFNPDEEHVSSAFAAGARGCLLKGVGGREFVEAVRAVHRGEGYVSPALGATMLALASKAKNKKNANEDMLARLNHREAQIFELMAGGLRNKEIGSHLNLAEKSIKRYVTRILEKLNVRNRVEAAMLWKSATPVQDPAAANGVRTLARPPVSARSAALNRIRVRVASALCFVNVQSLGEWQWLADTVLA